MHICFNMRVLKYGGDIAVSAMTVLFSMFQFINLPLTGISQGSQPIVGFNSAPDLVSLGSRMLRVYISGCFFIGANSLYQVRPVCGGLSGESGSPEDDEGCQES